MLQREDQELKDELTKIEKALTKERRELRDASISNDFMAEEIEGLQAERDLLESQLTHSRRTIESMLKTIELMQKTTNDKDEDIMTLSERNKRLVKEVEQQRKKIRCLTLDVFAAQDTISDMKDPTRQELQDESLKQAVNASVSASIGRPISNGLWLSEAARKDILSSTRYAMGIFKKGTGNAGESAAVAMEMMGKHVIIPLSNVGLQDLSSGSSGNEANESNSNSSSDNTTSKPSSSLDGYTGGSGHGIYDSNSINGNDIDDNNNPRNSNSNFDSVNA